jgi:2-keto-4-pentenoate hydratase/2-oxohepta-3-ene-1,7-dioic acid hydratase in catechol pathway
VSYDVGEGPRAGIVDGAVVVDAGASIRSLLGAGDLEAGVAGVDPGVGHPLDDVELLPPVPDPGKVVCLGLNYRAHAAEAGMDPPESPTFFAKFANALTGPRASVPFPKAGKRLDFEAEVAFVIARRAKDVDEADALEHVAGFMLFNDLSARDLQFATPQWMPGKVFDGSAPCGPALVTPDEAGPHDAIEFTLSLNGERMQAASTDDLVFSVPELVARLSALMTLEPGDVIATGTPSGVGSTRDPPVWLGPGDELVIESPTLGRLESTIA